MRLQSSPTLSTLLAVASLLVTPMLLRPQQTALTPGEAFEPPSSSDSTADTAASTPLPVKPAAAPSISSARTATTQTEFAVEALTLIADRYHQAGNRPAEAHTLSALATSYGSLRQQQKALELFQSALAIWRELVNKEDEASTLAHIGDVYREWGFPDQAVHFYRDALKYYQENPGKAEEAAVLNNLALSYFVLRDRKKCLSYLDQAASSYRAHQDRHGEALTLVNLGSVYGFLMNDPHKALDLFQEAITQLELLNDRAAEANAMDIVGELWQKLGKPEMAVISFQHALTLYGSLGDTKGEAAVRKHQEALGLTGAMASR